VRHVVDCDKIKAFEALDSCNDFRPIGKKGKGLIYERLDKNLGL
jgi:hypothetical protein